MNIDSHNVDKTPSIENLRKDLETLKKDLLKTKQELGECLDKNLHSSKEHTYFQRDIRDFKYEMEGLWYYQAFMTSHINQAERVLERSRIRISYFLANNELKNFEAGELF